MRIHRGLISLDGSIWHSQRFDRFGNAAEEPKRIMDAGERSLSDQVSEIADALEEYLAGRFDFPITARRAVVLTNARCELGSIREPQLDSILKIGQATPAAIFAGRSYDLSPESVDKLVDLIRRDHEYTERRREERRRRREESSGAGAEAAL